MRSMPVAESAMPCHASPALARTPIVGAELRGRDDNVQHSPHSPRGRHSATHAHARNNPGEITTPALQHGNGLPSSTGVSLKAHSRFSGTTASRLSRSRTGFSVHCAVGVGPERLVHRHSAGLVFQRGRGCGEVEEVGVVTNTRPDDQIGVSVSVIDEDTMRSLAYPDLASLLDTQPGVTVTMDGGYGKAAAVRIRGEEGYRTRIVLDGINIADPSPPGQSPYRAFGEQRLDPGEILRGPQGLLWGADAGGVILMSTTDAAAESGLGGFGSRQRRFLSGRH